MPTITELVSQDFRPEPFARRVPQVTILTAPLPMVDGAQRYSEYEAEVFNYLLEHMDALGIKRILVFRNLLVDGAIEFKNDKRLVIEIKLRMNWEKACQAEWEFRNFLLKKGEAKKNPVSGGIVFFEEFSADWARKFECRKHENGWSHWYEGHCKVEGLRLDLLRLRQGELTSFPSEESYCP